MLDMTGKSVSRLGTKSEIFFEKFFFEKKLRKCRIVPKNEKGRPFGIH